MDTQQKIVQVLIAHYHTQSLGMIQDVTGHYFHFAKLARIYRYKLEVRDIDFETKKCANIKLFVNFRVGWKNTH